MTVEAAARPKCGHRCDHHAVRGGPAQPIAQERIGRVPRLRYAAGTLLRVSNLVTYLMALAALCSGAAALTLEVVWSKALVVPLGNSSDANAIVLGGFMLGIALGARVGAKLAERAARALVWYAGLELVLALFALVVPRLLTGLAGVTLPGPSAQSSAFAFSARLVIALGWITLPCLVMGATLPLLLATPVARSRPRSSAGLLYGINTLGATLAALTTGFWGVPNWGILGCSRRAAAFSAAAALVAIGLHRWQRSRFNHQRTTNAATRLPTPSDASTSRPPAPCDDSNSCLPAPSDDLSAARDQHTRSLAACAQSRLAMLATFVSGFCLLASEVLWARLLTFVFGHDTYAFATLLGVVLLGLGLGGVGYAALARFDPRRVAGWAMAATALALLGSFYVASWLLIRGGRDPLALGDHFLGSTALSVEMAREFAFTPILVLLPCVASGIGYPATIALFAGSRATLARATGMVGLCNGIGATLGATLTSIGLVSWLGIQGTLTLAATGSLLMGTWLLGATNTSKARRFYASVPLALGAAIALLVPRDLPRRVLLSVVGPRHQTLLHYEEARTATVSVIKNTIHGERQLLVNAVNEVTTRLVHDQSFKLLGQLGPLLHPDPKTAVMICLGAGLAAGSALAHPLERLDVVDLLQAVRRGASYFPEENNHVLEDPRLVLHVDDGRQYLLTTARRYDLAIVDSTHPKSVDSWILYTQEFFELLRSRLNPDGIVVEWLPLHGLSEPEFIAVVATFASVFPQMTLWASAGYETYGQVGYAKLVGQRSDGPLGIDVARMLERLAVPRVAADLTRYGMGDLPEILDQFVAGPARIHEWVAGSPRLSDDRPFLAYLTPLSAGRPMTPERLLALREPVGPWLLQPERLDPRIRDAVERAYEAQGLVLSGQLERAQAYYPTGKKIRAYVEQTKTSLPYYSELGRRYADDSERLFEAGTQLNALGHPNEARAVFALGLARTPESLRLRMNDGWIQLGAGEPRAAAEIFQTLLRRYPHVALLNQNLGAALLEQHEPGAARRALTLALGQDPHSLGIRLSLADAEMALAHWQEAKRLLSALVRDEPRMDAAIERLATIEERLGDSDTATKLFARAARLNPYREDYSLAWGNRLIASQPEAALAILQRVESLFADSASAKVAVGNTWLRLEHWENAAQKFELALEHDPRSAEAAMGLGRALARLERKSAATEALCLAVKLGGPRPQALVELRSIGEKIEVCSAPATAQ